MTARIREQRGCDFIPIIFLSGEEDKDAQLDAIAIGGDAFLTKPVLPRHLVTEVMTRAQRARDLKHGIDRGRYGSLGTPGKIAAVTLVKAQERSAADLCRPGERARGRRSFEAPRPHSGDVRVTSRVAARW